MTGAVKVLWFPSTTGSSPKLSGAQEPGGRIERFGIVQHAALVTGENATCILSALANPKAAPISMVTLYDYISPSAQSFRERRRCALVQNRS